MFRRGEDFVIERREYRGTGRVPQRAEKTFLPVTTRRIRKWVSPRMTVRIRRRVARYYFIVVYVRRGVWRTFVNGARVRDTAGVSVKPKRSENTTTSGPLNLLAALATHGQRHINSLKPAPRYTDSVPPRDGVHNRRNREAKITITIINYVRSVRYRV